MRSWRVCRSLPWRSFVIAGGVLFLAFASGRSTGAEIITDCWSSTTCEDGVVTLILPSSGCGEPPEIIENAYVCEKGCRTDGSGFFGGAPQYACEEWRTKAVGDPCTTRRDCLPTTFGTYLTCDPETQACIETDPPVIQNYLAQCGVEDSDVKFPYAQYFGFVPSNGCDFDTCLVAADIDCIRQGCTLPCEFDQDCPAGSVCDQRRDWSDFKLRFEVKNVCAPDRVANRGIECPAE